jgi:uncharacterized protein (DUF1330 family)
LTAFVIAHVEILDAENYREYRDRNTAIVERYGGHFAARGGLCERLEGDAGPYRLVIIEFPDVDAARRWYYSPEYQEIAPIRRAYARTHLLSIVEGA